MMKLSTEDRPAVRESSRIVDIRGETDLLLVRSTLRAAAVQAGLNLTASTKLITAGSELARNIIAYATGGRGRLQVEHAADGPRVGVRATFTDDGPGIADLDAAMTDGFSTAGSLGLGLPGSRRLVDDFTLHSRPDVGTTVVIVQWAR